MAPVLNPMSVKNKIRDRLQNVHLRKENVFSEDDWLINALRIAGGVVILVIGHVVGAKAASSVRKASDVYRLSYRTDTDGVVVAEFEERIRNTDGEQTGDGVGNSIEATATYWVILVSALVVVLVLFGVRIASVIALLFTLVVVIGLSLQGTMNDIASGLIMLMTQTYGVGDVIEVDGREGEVLDFRLLNTVIEELGTRVLVTIPNRMVYKTPVSNRSRMRYHYYSVDVMLANTRFRVDPVEGLTDLDYDELIAAVTKELSDRRKYGEVMLHHPDVPVKVALEQIDGSGTLLRARVPMLTTDDLSDNRGIVKTGVGALMTRMGVQLKESDYTFFDFDREAMLKRRREAECRKRKNENDAVPPPQGEDAIFGDFSFRKWKGGAGEENNNAASV